MPTIKQMADELGVSPQTIRTFVKKELGVVSKERQPIMLDMNQAQVVAHHFKKEPLPAWFMEQKKETAASQEERPQPQLPFQGDAGKEAAVLEAKLEGKQKEIELLGKSIELYEDTINTLREEKAELQQQVAALNAEVRELLRQQRGGFLRRLLGSGKRKEERGVN